MHISNPVQPPAPVNLLEDDDTEENVEAEHAVYKFILSAMTPQEKIHYSAMIEELGGTICDSQYFTLECTHVIVGAPNRYIYHAYVVFQFSAVFSCHTHLHLILNAKQESSLMLQWLVHGSTL